MQGSQSAFRALCKRDNKGSGSLPKGYLKDFEGFWLFVIRIVGGARARTLVLTSTFSPFPVSWGGGGGG